MTRRYLPSGAVLLEPDPAIASAIAVHTGLADPHTGYRLESDDHSHQSTGLQAGQLDHGLALTGLADDDHPQYLSGTRHSGFHCSLHAERITSAQSIAHATIVTVIYNSIVNENDPDSLLALNTSTGEITVSATGWYMINAGVLWVADADATRRYIDISINGTRAISDDDFGTDSSTPTHHLGLLYPLTASDVVTVNVFQTQSAAASRDISAVARTHVAIARLS